MLAGRYPSPVGLRFETRGSDSPWVDTVWTCTSEQVTTMTSVAGVRWGLVFWEQAGRTYASITGPETRTGTEVRSGGASSVQVAADERLVDDGDRPRSAAIIRAEIPTLEQLGASGPEISVADQALPDAHRLSRIHGPAV